MKFIFFPFEVNFLLEKDSVFTKNSDCPKVKMHEEHMEWRKLHLA